VCRGKGRRRVRWTTSVLVGRWSGRLGERRTHAWEPTIAKTDC
jgi:hypothetical protein